jgi:hypothetical protein
MSTDLIDYLYLEAKEKAFEIEIEARKDFEARRNTLVKQKRDVIKEIYENEDKNKQTEFKQSTNQEAIAHYQPEANQPAGRPEQGTHQAVEQNPDQSAQEMSVG